MLKKYKKLLMNLIFYILIIAAMSVLIKYVYALNIYNGTDGEKIYNYKDGNEFMKEKAANLLGRKLFDDEEKDGLWKELKNAGKLACFYHRESGYKKDGMNNTIHSVFDVSFDTKEGRMKVYSIINDGIPTSMTTYASSTNTEIGRLAAEASASNNALNVQHALYAAIKGNKVVNEAAILKEETWKGGEGDADINKNPASQEAINELNNYKKIAKETVKDENGATSNAEEKSQELILNQKEYTIMGPFRMSFSGKGISSITASNATWTEKDKSSMYWATEITADEKSWFNDFNSASDSGEYELNEKNFYLAVETSKLADEGTYTVTFKQDSFSYTNARIVVCTGNRSQQTGMYFYDNTPHTVNGEISWTLKRKSLVSLEIAKKDVTNKTDLSGAKFKIYGDLSNGENGWLSGEADGTKSYESEVSKATEYDSSVKITKLKKGTYYIYETKSPAGYDITKQPGYHNGTDAVASDKLTGDWVYLGKMDMTKYKSGGKAYAFTAYNSRIISGIEGKVWVDEPDTKLNATDNVYKESSKDFLKEGVTVNLYDGNNTLLATTKTDKSGKYKFTTKNATSYKGNDKNIYYWDLASAYVEFIYNNKTTYNSDGTVKEYGYIAVDPFVGEDVSANSKAQEYTVTTAKLDDNNLTGTDGDNPGRAVTKGGDATVKPLTDYYNDSTYSVSNINLGLLEQYDPDFSVDETLAYIKVKMKGYTYTYKYGDAPATTSTNVPTVNEQNSAKTFTGKIYPTDIAYNVANQNDELKVYAVYSIDVKNLETMNVDNIYSEQKLYINSLVNTYDAGRYELCNNENNSDKADFALWSNDGNGKAKYDVSNENSVYKDGMNKQESKTAYIQFKVKQEALKKILEKSLSYEDIENAPTVATAEGYHEYLRTDNAWIHDEKVRYYTGAKRSDYTKENKDKKKYYAHRTVNKSRSSADLYLKLSLGDPRKLTGTVFEDTATSESKRNNESIGNGILDSNESNRAQDVTVELLNADKTTVSKLYKESNGKVVYNQDGSLPDARVTTKVGGTYEFEGVVPGYYYVRFTYGNGQQKLMPAGKVIKSNDYKSTIINTENGKAGDIIKNAMETSAENLNTIRAVVPTNQTEAQKKIVEWYKYLNANNYSAAVDDLTQRSLANTYKYKDDGKVYDASGNVVNNYPANINAYTPMASISIENDINNSTDAGDVHKPNYDKFNLGIIEQPKTEISLDKKITNIKLTTQTGTTLVSANPTDKSANYITALDKVAGGSKYAKVEMDESMIYGSALETTYEIVISNESAKDYIEGEGSDEFGDYYYYGKTSSSSKLKKVKVEEVVDELDNKYKYDTNQLTAKAYVRYANGQTEQTEISISKENPNGSTEKNNSIKMTGWKSFETGTQESMSYTVTSLLSSDNDTAYQNKAKVTTITLDKISNLKSDFNWEKTKDTTTLTITPPTGSDKRTTYWIAGAIGLIVIAGGILLIKKKVLKK